MIERIKGIAIKGRCFANECTFSFYPEENNRISIVYGKNGSGKSTISDGFSCISSGNFPADLSASLIDGTGNAISLSTDKNIHVFNEKYIDNNVKIDEDGLGTIILLGGQVDLQSEIDRYIELEKTTKTEVETLQTALDGFYVSSNPISPEYHTARIKKALQSEWAVKDAELKGNKINSKVTEDVIKRICELDVTESIAQLQQNFEDTKEMLEKVSDTSTNYPSPVCKIIIDDDFEENLCKLLLKSIEKPVLTERETLILDAIQKGRQTFVENAKRDFSDPSSTVCPYCFRDIDESYKQNLVDSINRVLNKDVDEHKAELESVPYPIITFDYSCFSDLDTKLVEKIIDQQSKCMEILNKYKSLVSEKQSNVYIPIKTSVLGLNGCLNDLNTLLLELEQKRQEFNDAIQKRKDLFQSLLKINQKIAHLRVEQMYRDFLKQEREKKAAGIALNKKKEYYLQITRHLQELEQQKSNVGLAISSINNALDYVFFTRDRLSIELKNNRYYLKSNGKDVKPKNISLGERNIIALCYFFTKILSNQEITKLYQTEELVVIDDPVSSFDFENKVGIISFLRYQFNRIIMGNANSKILVFSHDLSTVFDLNKAAEEICQSTKGIAQLATTTYYPAELCGSLLKRFTKRRSEYCELLADIYRYAKGDAPDRTLVIGNSMRRALEVFSTFTYRKSIEDVIYSPSVVKQLNNHSVYFENLMCRLVLHGESHFEEQVYNLHDDANFYEYISDAEKQRTSKDILCFMYFLNPHHVEAYLKEIAGAMENIKNWSKNIPLNDSFEVKEMHVIPLFDLPLSAGSGIEIFDGTVGYEDYSTAETRCDFALRISGDSMEPTISDGSIVLIKKEEIVPFGKVGAFCLNGSVYCKRLIKENGKVFLVSDNSKYKRIEIHDHDVLTTYGQVVKVVH